MAETAGARDRLKRGLARIEQIGKSRRTRKTGLIALIIIAVYGITAFFGVPPLVRHLATQQMSQWLERPVTIGDVSFNPYALRLDMQQIHIGERNAGKPFVDIDHLRVDAAWSSLFRRAPVIDELLVEKPSIHITRTAEQRFNFSDLIDKIHQPPQKAPSGPARFAVNNVQIHDGAIYLDDKVAGAQHVVDNLQLGIPFIANLPSDTDIFVQPLLQASVDGSPLRIAGKTKPFATSLDSFVDLNVDKLDLPRYLGYAPKTLPVTVKSGLLSGNLLVHFKRTGKTPRMVLTGTVALDNIDMRDKQDGALIALKHAEANLASVEPLRNIFHLNQLQIDGLAPNIVIDRTGQLNFQKLAAQPTAPAAAPASTPAAAPAKTASADAQPLDLSIAAFNLKNSTLHFTDQRTPKAEIGLQGLIIAAQNLQTIATAPGSYGIRAQLSSGGNVATQGSFNLQKQQASGTLNLGDIALAPLKSLVPGVGADIRGGKVDAHVKFTAGMANHQFNVQAENGNVALSQLEMQLPARNDEPVKVGRLTAGLTRFDLASRQAVIGDVHATGLVLPVRRDHQGAINLASMVGAPNAANASRSARHTAAASPVATAPAWRWQIGSVELEKADVSLVDEAASERRSAKLDLSPLDVKLKGLSQDLSKPIDATISGTLNHKGTLNLTAAISPQPLKGDVQVRTQRLDLAAFEPYLGGKLNAAIASGLLTTDGKVGIVQDGAGQIKAHFRGNATLGNVRILDRLTSDDFLRWNALTASHLAVSYGEGEPKVFIGGLSLSKFYARIIINSSGRINLQDIVAGKTAAPKSLTRAAPEEKAPAPAPAAPAPAVTAEAAPVPGAASGAGAPGSTTGQPLPASINVSSVTLQGGNINFTDNFIKPNYTANLTDITGKVGKFGTRTTTPADVVVKGRVDHDAPIDITGKVNPLAPTAFVDLSAKADGVELTHLTPYSAKYTGYPIIKGKLTLDLHYLLDQGKLSANNHIFIDQLTFGDKVKSPDATNLPVRLAVALLKNSRGEIDVTVPVSGSLSDPQFSLGSVIWHSFANLITKAVTAPFQLLASALGGSSEELSYVEFAPGSAALAPGDTKKLETLVKALNDRPSLRLDIIGRVDPEYDRNGLRKAMVDRLVKAQKLKSLASHGESINVGDVKVEPSEYDKYLEQAYKAAKFDKPRNFIGFAKSLPPDEMKKLMLANMKVTDDDLRELANRRADAVRQWLEGKIAAERVFIVAPKLNADGIKDKGKTTRVDFSLK